MVFVNNLTNVIPAHAGIHIEKLGLAWNSRRHRRSNQTRKTAEKVESDLENSLDRTIQSSLARFIPRLIGLVTWIPAFAGMTMRCA